MINHKITLWAIIVLLILFIPLTIFSTYMHFNKGPVVQENPNHEFKFENKLYFYNEVNELIGKYECSNSICDLAINSNNEDYSLEEYEDEDTKFELVNNRYAFICDKNDKEKEEIKLYDLSLNRILATYKAVKNYGIGIEGDIYIVKNNDDKYGVIGFNEGIALKIPFKYDYIGLVNKIDSETEKIASSKYAVMKDKKWQLTDLNNAEFTSNIDGDIASYNEEYIILKNGSNYKLIDYNGRNYLNEGYLYLGFYSKYIEIIDNFNNFYLYNMKNSEKISKEYSVKDISDVDLKQENNNIIISINGQVKETVANS